MMNADFFYTNAFGRGVLKVMLKAGMFKPVAWYLHTKASKRMISRYIEKNGIDMRPYGDRVYSSFADFFGRKRAYDFSADAKTLIAPCDSLLSAYDITSELEMPIKGSIYTVEDLVPDREIAELFKGGLALVFRLEASDYHHFCFFDDGKILKRGYIPGSLHSVQPIALRHFPVFRLNRRWWSIFETEHFGKAVQTEIGAMAVGGITFTDVGENFRRGEEMGNFELAGSTIVVLLTAEAKSRLNTDIIEIKTGPCDPAAEEVRVTIGSVIGVLKNED